MNKSTLALAIVAGIVGLPSVQQASAAGFIEDSKATLGLRNFYFNQDVRSADVPSVKEWGQGFTLNYTSGYTQGTVGVGVDALALLGVKLDSGGRLGKAGIERTPSQLFPLESNGKAADEFSHLGLTGKVKVSKTEARLGTLLPRLPVVVYNDGRLLPQTYEGGQITSNEIDNLTLIGGQLEHTKLRASSDRQGLSAGGATASDTNKFYYGGADYRIGKELLLQYYYGNLEGYYKQHFLGLTHTLALPRGSLVTDLRYFDSSSDGKNSSTAGRAAGYKVGGDSGRLGSDPDKGEIDSQLSSAQFTWKVGGHALGLGYQHNGGDSVIGHLNQGSGVSAYTIAERQIGGFRTPGADVWIASYAYDFAALGVPGLTARAVYNKGVDYDVASQPGDVGEWERDLRLDYVVQSGTLKGLGLAWLNASLRSDLTTQPDLDENRLVVSYSLPLL